MHLSPRKHLSDQDTVQASADSLSFNLQDPSVNELQSRIVGMAVRRIESSTKNEVYGKRVTARVTGLRIDLRRLVGIDFGIDSFVCSA